MHEGPTSPSTPQVVDVDVVDLQVVCVWSGSSHAKMVAKEFTCASHTACKNDGFQQGLTGTNEDLDFKHQWKSWLVLTSSPL